MARLRREAPATARRLTDWQVRTLSELSREADLLGDASMVALCARALAGDTDAAALCLAFELELRGQLN